MAIELNSGKTVRVKISKTINREAARKTIERLFRQDKSLARDLDKREANFLELPKRRGGCIWTKRPNKLHLPLNRGDEATLRTTPQSIRDLSSVASFVEVSEK